MRKIDLPILIFLGVLSGISSVFADSFYKDAIFTPIPGIIYGIALGIYFLFKKNVSFVKVLFFFVGSTFAYYVAFWTTMVIFTLVTPQTASWYTPHTIQNLPVYCLVAGGVIGALLLSIAIRLFLEKISFIEGVLLVFGGGVLTLTWYLIPATYSNEFYGNAFSLFICWQVGMNLLLYFLPSKFKIPTRK